MLLGALGVLLMFGVGLFWLQGRAKVETAAPPPSLPIASAPAEGDLPLANPADFADLRGPAPPEATELTREQQRFFRYDRDRNWRISRAEMLSTRSDAFRKLDRDGNNLLTFEEWAVATVNKFENADADGNQELTPAEFLTTRPKPSKPKPRCSC